MIGKQEKEQIKECLFYVMANWPHSYAWRTERFNKLAKMVSWRLVPNNSTGETLIFDTVTGVEVINPFKEDGL